MLQVRLPQQFGTQIVTTFLDYTVLALNIIGEMNTNFRAIYVRSSDQNQVKK